VVYVAFALVGLYVGSLVRRPVHTTAWVLAGLIAATLGWALLGKVFPGLFPDGKRVARLRNPVGYWNALALVAGIALPLALWLAAGRRHLRAVRAAGALLLYAAVVALVLTYSRAGIVVSAIGVCLWLALCDDRFEGLVMLVAGAAPAVVVAGWASTQPGLVDDLQGRATRERAGAWFALALVAGAVAVLVLAHVAARLGDRVAPQERRRWTTGLGVGIALAAVLGAAAVTAAKGGPGKWLDEFRGTSEAVQTSGRLGELSSNNRWQWWKESWQLFREAPAGGKGARTFEIARRPLRKGSIVASEPHSIALQSLAETGVIGLLVGIGAVGLALLAVAEGLRRLQGEERAAGAALAVALPVYVLHALVDIDWDFVAVTAPVFVICGCLFAAGRPPRAARGRPMAALAAGVAGLAVLYSLTAPWYAHRKVDDAYAAIDRGDARGAVSAARQAHDLNPFSTDALTAWALAAASGGDIPGALRRFRQAVDLQPENPDTWYALGEFEFLQQRYLPAYRYLDRAWGLDPYGPAGVKGGLLDQARAKVNAGIG
jgi:tetratricopeptide (TPR) repeat protein